MGHHELRQHAGMVAKPWKLRKTCNTCRTEKPLRSFYRYRRNKDGRLNQCKRCFLEAAKRRKAERCINSAWTED